MAIQMKYFVLKPKGANPYAKASRAALRVYAEAIKTHNEQLAHDLRSWAHEESYAVGAPDWPPQASARGIRDGERRHGSTGQLFEARNGQWVRV